jgi:hypothetical protein
VHVTSAHPVHDIRIFTKQCRTLAAAGYDVVLVAQHDRDEVVDGIKIRAVRPARSRAGRMTHTAFRAMPAAAAENASLYHLHDPELLVWAPLLHLRGARVVFDMHENMPVAITTKGCSRVKAQSTGRCPNRVTVDAEVVFVTKKPESRAGSGSVHEARL